VAKIKQSARRTVAFALVFSALVFLRRALAFFFLPMARRWCWCVPFLCGLAFAYFAGA
jgi:hypothetical protein